MNAYRITVTNPDQISEWWYGSSNPFGMHGYHAMRDGSFLLVADVSDENDAALESWSRCTSWSHCRVDSPQVGDAEPIAVHETIDGGEQLLWVS